jgi:hypothetical protein
LALDEPRFRAGSSFALLAMAVAASARLTIPVKTSMLNISNHISAMRQKGKSD